MEKKENVSGSIRAKDGVQNGIVSEDEFQRVANKVSFVTIIGNILLSVMKLIAGFIAHSNAMISDAIHSASDVFSTFVVIIGIKLASKKADKEHPYGHERLECVAAIVLSMVLFITGFGIGAAALKNITSGDYNNIVVPGILALVAAIVSIVSKEAMYWYTRYNAKKDRFKCTYGRCMASSFRCLFINRSTYRYCRCKIRLSYYGFNRQSDNICIYHKGSL